MVLCAGYGTRLGRLTQETPKPMLRLQGRPLLEYIIAHLGRHKFTRVAINLHFQPEQIPRYFGGGALWEVELEYSHESELLGTAGGAKKMAPFLKKGEVFLIQYGDILTDQDLTSMLAFHHDRRALVTLLLHRRTRSNSIVTIDSSGRIVGFRERPEKDVFDNLDSVWVNSGLYICDPALLELIPENRPCDFPRDIFPELVNTGRLFGFPLSGYRCAIDSSQRLAEAQTAVAEGRCKIELPQKDG